MEGIAAMQRDREGGVTLRNNKIKSDALPKGRSEIDQRR